MNFERDLHPIRHGHNEPENLLNNKIVGLSIGILAVIVAVTAALGSSQRDKMTQAMIRQSQAIAKEASGSAKLRSVLIELERLSSLPKEKRSDRELRDQLSFYSDYLAERNISKEWAESMDPSIEIHLEATEDYDTAQLLAEMGIAIASLSMLIHSRKVWYLSLVLGALSMLQLSKTSYIVHHENTSIEMKIGEIAKRYEDLRGRHENNGADARLIKELDPTGNILRSIQQ
jgi:hypothetical protein